MCLILRERGHSKLVDHGEVLAHAQAFAHALQNSQTDLIKGYLAMEYQADILNVLDGLGAISSTEVMTVTRVETAHLPEDADGPEYVSIVSVAGSQKSLLRTTWVESADGNRLLIKETRIVG